MLYTPESRQFWPDLGAKRLKTVPTRVGTNNPLGSEYPVEVLRGNCLKTEKPETGT